MLVLGRHVAERNLAFMGQVYHLSTSICGGRTADNVSGGDEPVDEAGEIAVRHHHPLREIRQHHAIGGLVELRHQVEAGKRDVEALAQATAHLALDHGGAGEKAQPEAQLLTMIVRHLDRLRLGVEGNCLVIHRQISPPANTMACPVTERAPSPHSQSTVSAISAGSIRRP